MCNAGRRAYDTLIMDTWAATESCRLHNVYGVTECTVYQMSHRVPPRTMLPPRTQKLQSQSHSRDDGNVRAEDGAMLGHGLIGNDIHLLDEQFEPILPPPPTSALCATPQGQIAISGSQLARGYLNRAELTAERFVTLDQLGGVRAYLTGDLARWASPPVDQLAGATPAAADAASGDAASEPGGVQETGASSAAPGMLRLCGRSDGQVKLNGVRLELGEVEGVLCGCEKLVRHAAALLIGKAPSPLRLVVAVTPCRTECIDDRLRSEALVALLMLHARRQLPAQVCPSEIVLLRELPLTPTGKLDRLVLCPRVEAALAGTTSAGTSAGGVAEAGQPPRGALERAVAAAWRLHLGVPSVTRRSDFMRLGGDSIKALQVTRSLALELGAPPPPPPSPPPTSTAAESMGGGGSGASEGTDSASALAGSDVPSFLGSPLPPAPGTSLAEVAESADYGVMRGVFAPAMLLRLPLMHRYAQYLRANGVRVTGEAEEEEAEAAEGSVRGDVGLSCAASGGPHASYDDAEAATAAEAEAAEAEDLLDALLRVRSELAADMDLAQSILQLALTIGARGRRGDRRHGASNGGGPVAPR